MKRTGKLFLILAVAVASATAATCLSGCGKVFFKDNTAKDPMYAEKEIPIESSIGADVSDITDNIANEVHKPNIWEPELYKSVNDGEGFLEIDGDGNHYLVELKEDNKSILKKQSFTLRLRQPSGNTETEEWDAYPHSGIDGILIYEWEIPMYGNTVYESVVAFFADRKDNMTFRLSQHKFYMFHDCTLLDGSYYNLETVYIAADGEYADCANYQTLFGEDEIVGNKDDLKILTLVYKGWLY